MGESGPPDLRVSAARGTLITAAFEVGLQGLSFLKAFVIAAFLTKAEYGVWGILVVTLGTLTWLKQVGISEKYVQQEEADQELAFQKAFTLDLVSNAALFALMLALLPVFAAVYGQWDIVAPGLVLMTTLAAASLRAPAWVFYRDMRFFRQRLLEAVDPVVAFVVSVGCAVAGLGYWSLVAGLAAGAWTAALAAVIASPYRLRLRWDGATARDYFGFSWPLFVASAAGLVIPQASMLAGNAALGVAGVGAIALAAAIATYTDRVDQIVTWALYPAICRVKDRVDVLYEAFVKTNRLTLMWGVPFGVGIALFAGDLVTHAIGEEWRDAAPLIAAFGLIAAVNHIGFNWHAFFRARGETKPLAVVTPIAMAAFLVSAVPLLFVWGLDGFAAGMAFMTLVSLTVRTWYLRRLFPQFRILRYAARALAPTVPAVAAVLALRAAVPDDTLGMAVAGLAVYVVVTVLATVAFERRLLREAIGYVAGRTRGTRAVAAGA